MQFGHNGWWQGVLLALALGVVVLMAPGPFALVQDHETYCVIGSSSSHS